MISFITNNIDTAVFITMNAIGMVFHGVCFWVKGQPVVINELNLTVNIAAWITVQYSTVTLVCGLIMKNFAQTACLGSIQMCLGSCHDNFFVLVNPNWKFFAWMNWVALPFNYNLYYYIRNHYIVLVNVPSTNINVVLLCYDVYAHVSIRSFLLWQLDFSKLLG